MRIGIVSNYFTPRIGGNEANNRLIGEALVRRGHDVTVLTRRYDPALHRREIQNGISIERFSPCGEGILAKWLMNVGLFRRLTFSRLPFDITLITQCSAHVLGPALAGILRRVPIVVQPIEAGELSGDISSQALRHLRFGIRQVVWKALSATRTWAYHRAHLVVAFSSALARDAEAFGFPSGAVVIIPNAVDTGRFRPVTEDEKAKLRASLGITPDAQVVTSVGRLVRGKGLLTLIEAWAIVAHDHPDALLFIVGSGPGVGSQDDTELSLRAAIKAAGLHDRVRLSGAVSDVKPYLQASDLFVFTSEQEGFGMALVEAMSCGLPVVCTRIEGAAADLVVDGEHGLKFDVGDAAALCARIERLLANEPMRRRMGAASRAIVEKQLSVDHVAAAYEQAFLQGRCAKLS